MDIKNNKEYCISRKTAFTLAEILITLGIIGVVSAMTMPVLIQKQHEKATVTRVLKAYSLLNQAYTMSKLENGNFASWFTSVSTSSFEDEDGNKHLSDESKTNKDIIYSKFAPYLKHAEWCKTDDTNCKKYDVVYNMNNEKTASVELDKQGYLKLADGTILFSGSVKTITDCKGNNKYCGDFLIDINGVEGKPNAYGKDIFVFYFTDEMMRPMGDEYAPGHFPSRCSLSSTVSTNGYDCAAWIIQNHNMDYLHCDDLSLDGKTKCK